MNALIRGMLKKKVFIHVRERSVVTARNNERTLVRIILERKKGNY